VSDRVFAIVSGFTGATPEEDGVVEGFDDAAEESDGLSGFLIWIRLAATFPALSSFPTRA